MTTTHNTQNLNKNAIDNEDFMITDFFKQLAKYYDHENDLSNVTCALCESSEFFREKFIHFFFPELNLNEILSIRREVPDKNNKGSRVDLYIEMQNEKPYLIEVKIYDKNHHFGQYEDAYDVTKERFGYITNYYCKEGIELGYDVKTWSDWFQYLKKAVHSNIAIEDKRLCTGYLDYVNSVCDFSELVTTLDFNEHTKQNFIKLCKFVLGSGLAPYECQPVSSWAEQDLVFFSITKNTIVYRFWLGVVNLNDISTICIASNKVQSNMSSVFDNFSNIETGSDGFFDSKIAKYYLGSKCIMLPMCEKKQVEFLKSKDPQKQKNILQEFLNRGIEYFAAQL